MKKLKLISIICSLMMVLSCFSVFPAWATSTTTYDGLGGSGTVADPYLLSNANFMDFLEKAKTNPGSFTTVSFKLIENIYINNGANDGDAEDWANGKVPTTVLTQPLVNENYNATFDGNGYAISGICIKAASGINEVALFKRLSMSQDSNNEWTNIGVVKNLRLVNSYFEASNTNVNFRMGSFVANMYYDTEVYNCYTDAILVNKSANSSATKVDAASIGGIAGAMGSVNTGLNWSPNIEKCVFAGKILDSVGGTGGMIGWIHNGISGVTVTDCLNLGSIQSSVSGAGVGAMIGGVQYKDSSTKFATLTKCMNLSTNVATDVLGNGNHQHLSVNNFNVVEGLRAEGNFVYPNNTTAWVSGMYFSALINESIVADGGRLAGWNYKAGYVPNPTTHTDIPLVKLVNEDTFNTVVNADTLGLATEGAIHSIRISNTNKGLRFETVVSDTGVALLEQLKTAGATVALNTYISAGKYFTDAQYGITEFTKEALDNGVEAGSRYLVVPADGYLRENGVNNETRNTFAGSVVGINDLTMGYIAVGCVTVTLDDASYDIYATWSTEEIASVSDVATVAADDTQATLDEVAGYKYQITDRNGESVYSPYTQAQYDCIVSLIAD